MALPSSAILGSAAFVVAAAAGLVVLASTAAADSTGAPRGDSLVAQGADAWERASAASGGVTEPPRRPEPVRRGHDARRPDAVPKVFVEVYNNSGVSGLAAAKARMLDGAGWNVAATDNWYGDIPENTVYYPPALAEPAKRLAKVLHLSRIRPAVSPMQFDRLTVILTSP